MDAICCLTGHRHLPPHQIPQIRQALETQVEKLTCQGVLTYRCGGALVFDTLAAQTILDWKTWEPRLRLELVLPCRDQTKGWPLQDVAHYQRILSLADQVSFITERYFPGCMQLRNRRLVEGSTHCICYCTKPTGGAAYTRDYAQKMGLQIYFLAPLCL